MTILVEEEIATIEPEIDESDYSDMGKLFLRAADAIVRYGWLQMDCGDTEHGFCAIGALNHVIGRADSRGYWFEVRRKHRPRLLELIRFNDTKGRDPWEVVAKLRELAKEV